MPSIPASNNMNSNTRSGSTSIPAAQGSEGQRTLLPDVAATLPTNVSVFFPADRSAYDNIQKATLFTRLHIRLSGQQVASALNRTPSVKQTFCMAHQNIILVFDTERETHIEHVKAVLQMLQDNKIFADIKRCIFNAADAKKAGFQLDPLGDHGAIMVVDLGLQSQPSEAD